MVSIYRAEVPAPVYNSVCFTDTALTAMTQRSDTDLASSIHASIDWILGRWNERESWDGVTVIILSLLVWMLSSFIVYIAWAGLAYGGWLVWKRGSANPLLKRD